MFKQKIGFDQWPIELQDKTNVSRERAADIHTVVASWEKRQISHKLAYKLLATIYWLHPEDGEVTRFYLNDMMQRMAFNGGFDETETRAMHHGIMALQQRKKQN